MQACSTGTLDTGRSLGLGGIKCHLFTALRWPTIEYLVVAYFWNFPVSIVEPSLAWDDSNLGN